VRARTLSHESEGHLALMWWKKSGQETDILYRWFTQLSQGTESEGRKYHQPARCGRMRLSVELSK